MGRRDPRLKNGLPRGGLGWAGWVAALGSLAAALLLRADVAIGATLLALPVCVWCMLGLRRDAAAGEVVDPDTSDSFLCSRPESDRPCRRRHSRPGIALRRSGWSVAVTSGAARPRSGSSSGIGRPWT